MSAEDAASSHRESDQCVHRTPAAAPFRLSISGAAASAAKGSSAPDNNVAGVIGPGITLVVAILQGRNGSRSHDRC